MKVIFLGTNGWFDTGTGNTVSILVKTKTCNIILDAGFGLAKADRYLDKKLPTYIFLSHLHLDHIVGLHTLAKFRFPKGLTIYVTREMISSLRRFIAHPFTIPIKNLLFKLRIQAASERFKIGNIRVMTAPLKHVSKCLGYRIEVENKTITYCTDTGICPGIFKLAKNTDLLIAECALRHKQDHGGWPHLAPEDAAMIAQKARVRTLVLTHFDADNHPTKQHRKRAQTHARKIFHKTVAAVDGLTLSL